MIPEIMVVPDNVAFYMRFSTEEQAKETPVILHKSQAEKLVNDLLKKINKVPCKLSIDRRDT